MIIENSRISMQSSHQFVQQEYQEESLRYWSEGGKEVGAEAAFTEFRAHTESSSLALGFDRVDFSQEAVEASEKTEGPEKAFKANIEELEKDLKHGWKLLLLARLVEQMTGKSIQLFRPKELEDPEGGNLPPGHGEGGPKPEERQGWGLAYQYEHSYMESERTSFSTQAQVRTADGRDISINIELTMSRAFASHQSFSFRAGDALKDPLVTNFPGTTEQLEQTDLQFDLDLDGTPDSMRFVPPGAGFLALDKNSDGLINDGRELFGPSSGDGFEELAAYDEDGNRWIDENDSVFDKLRIWERDSQGNFNLFSLARKGIGAISLQSVETPFSVKDSDNSLEGQVQKTGFFLREDGSAGTVQQLDLVV